MAPSTLRRFRGGAWCRRSSCPRPPEGPPPPPCRSSLRLQVTERRRGSGPTHLLPCCPFLPSTSRGSRLPFPACTVPSSDADLYLSVCLPPPSLSVTLSVLLMCVCVCVFVYVCLSLSIYLYLSPTLSPSFPLPPCPSLFPASSPPAYRRRQPLNAALFLPAPPPRPTRRGPSDIDRRQPAAAGTTYPPELPCSPYQRHPFQRLRAPTSAPLSGARSLAEAKLPPPLPPQPLPSPRAPQRSRRPLLHRHRRSRLADAAVGPRVPGRVAAAPAALTAPSPAAWIVLVLLHGAPQPRDGL